MKPGAPRPRKVNMRTKNLPFLLIAGAVLLTTTGCIAPSLQSMGSAPMTTAHQPKATPAGEKQVSASIDAFGTFGSTGFNVEQVNAGGGAATIGFHPAGALSPLFVSASVAGYAGTLQFGCNDTPCSSEYNAWLASDEGDENYTFWNIQERILAGAEFNIGNHFFAGAAGGLQFYQGGGDYESKRDRLETLRLVENVDGRYDWRPTASAWFGPRFGENGSAGAISIEYAITFAKNAKEWNSQLGISYFHPSGFHGGVFTNSNASFVASLGKTFLF